jgi:predicted Zn-dependent protease
VSRRVALLRLLPIAPLATDVETARLGADLTRRTGIPSVEMPHIPVQPGWRSGDGKALLSASVVDFLISRFPQQYSRDGIEWTLALTSLDLVVPGRPYVFGEATLGGAWAVVGISRLRAPEHPGDVRVLRARLLRESLHELGHLAGLSHCQRAACVMEPSAAPADVDLKPDDFCEACRSRFDALVRGTSAP